MKTPASFLEQLQVCRYEGLQLYEKATPCESFTKHNFKGDCWATALDFQQHFGTTACFISNKSTH